jgi:response regulator RpfG family c-di-GMP phosphodiesterase
MFACIMFIMITVFDVNRWVFLLVYSTAYLLLMREIEALLGTEMMYVSAIYSGLMILIAFVLDRYSCANIEQMLILQKYNEELEREIQVKTQSLQDQLHKTEMIQEKTLAGLADIIENRDSNTGEHTKHTQSIVRDMLSELKKLDGYQNIVSKSYEDRVVKAAPLHDIGKISISDVILNAPRKLTPEEFEIMKTHTTEGAKIVRTVLTGIEEEPYIDTAEDIVRYHHERWDGKGYPEGLAGADIPLSARIMAIADVYDALTSERCYKPPYTKEAALDIMREGYGTQFDPILLDIFLNKVAKQY